MDQKRVNEINCTEEKTVIMKSKINKVYTLDELEHTSTAANNETVFIILNS